MDTLTLDNFKYSLKESSEIPRILKNTENVCLIGRV